MEGHSPTGAAATAVVVCANEQDDVHIETRKWAALAERALGALGSHGELTLTFVEPAEIADLNATYMGNESTTDVLSFPLDAQSDDDTLPRLLGDVVICPAVAAEQAPAHAGTLADELALLVVHGILHVIGWDHAGDDDAAAMRQRERELLTDCFWHGPPPSGFRHEHLDGSR